MQFIAWIVKSWLGRLVLKYIWDKFLKVIGYYVAEYLRHKKQENEIRRLEKVEREIEEANKIGDANERLKEKARLGCELERSLDSDHSC